MKEADEGYDDRVTELERVACAAAAAAEKQAEDVVVLDVTEQLGITDQFVICSAPTDRQLRTIVDEIRRQLKDLGEMPLRTEGEREGGWVLLDYGDFVVHAFRTAEREFYDLERLWKDAPRLDVLEPEGATG